MNMDRVGAARRSALESGKNYVPVKLPTSGLEAEICYEFRGKAGNPIIVFVHGIASGSLVFDDVAARLVSNGYQCLTFDFIGRANSVAPAENGVYNTTMHIEQIYTLLEALSLLKHRNLTIAGYSMGGVIVTKFVDVSGAKYRLYSTLVLLLYYLAQSFFPPVSSKKEFALISPYSALSCRLRSRPHLVHGTQ
jgi:pimeloyl-ACP methyl ester carboxylesterase